MSEEAKVVVLSEVPRPKDVEAEQSGRDLVAMIEKLLERAKSGEVVAVAMAYALCDGAGNAWHCHNGEHRGMLYEALDGLKWRMVSASWGDL